MTSIGRARLIGTVKMRSHGTTCGCTPGRQQPPPSAPMNSQRPLIFDGYGPHEPARSPDDGSHTGASGWMAHQRAQAAAPGTSVSSR